MKSWLQTVVLSLAVLVGLSLASRAQVFIERGAELTGAATTLCVDATNQDACFERAAADIMQLQAGDALNLNPAGVRLSSDGDGALTVLGLGDGSDEDLTINLDDTANTVVVSSSTGVTAFALSGFNVGIGTTAPASLLDVTGGLTTVGAVLTLGTNEPTVVLNDILGRINFYAPLEDSGGDALLVGASIAALAEGTFDATTNTTSLIFQTGASEAATTKMTLTSAGWLGIGTTPAGSFHVRSASAGAVVPGVSADEGIFEGSGNSGISILTPDVNTSTVVFGSPSNDTGAYHRWNYSSLLFTISTNVADASIRFNTGVGAERVRILGETGNVGIGTTSPTGLLSRGGANASQFYEATQTEAHTLALAATSDTTITYPASSTGLSASFRITTEITGCTSVQVGIAGDTTRFGTFSTLTAGQTIAIARVDNYTSATAIRFTAVGGGASFTAGAIRVVIHHNQASAPTS